MTDRHDSSSPPPGPLVAPDDEPTSLAIQRDELAALAAGYRRSIHSPRMRTVGMLGFGAFLISTVLVVVAERLGLPDQTVGPFIFAGAWGTLLTCYGVLWRWDRQARAKYQFQCPGCDTPLLDGSTERGLPSPLDLAIASGHCPRCGARIIARDV